MKSENMTHATDFTDNLSRNRSLITTLIKQDVVLITWNGTTF